ncbi:MAG TPA: twin-arginine translocase subunit TatC [Candidatus Paceibacterota bacterium]|nr:twin-arginine translocase subunit TatC [Candidatus Paceibacterota bacterium]
MAGIIKKTFSKYYPYLEDIRQRVYGLVVIFLSLFVIGFLGAGLILSFLIKIFQIKDVSIVTTSPFQFIDLAMNVGLLFALVLCLPLVVYHIYAFLKDCLNKNEKKLFLVLLPTSLILFVLGFAYGFGVLYYALGAIAKINVSMGVANLWDINKFLSQIGLSAALLGILFQFPIILSFLIKAKIITTDVLKNKRRYAIATILIFTAFLPPTDGLSLIVMVLPLIIMYELVIWISPKPIKKKMVYS